MLHKNNSTTYSLTGLEFLWQIYPELCQIDPRLIPDKTPPSNISPEKLLMAAVLLQAQYDLIQSSHRNDPESRRKTDEVIRWLCDSESYLFSFISICQLWDLSENAVRSALLKLIIPSNEEEGVSV